MSQSSFQRTSFRFDMMPWKLVFCEVACANCPFGHFFLIKDLPDPPEPGRVPKDVDHLHIVPKLSGERDAREEEKWRALLWGTARCDHGRLPGDRCRGCGAFAPNMEGVRIGTTSGQKAIIIPTREEMKDIAKWFR